MRSDVARVLQNTEEREAARDIVRKKYEEQGYDVSSGGIAQYLDTPHATIFGIFYEDTLYGTISLVRDSTDGLPMDSLYSNELSLWRSQERKIAEVVQFAVDHDRYTALAGKEPSPFIAAPLLRKVFSYAQEEHIEYLCISINPKHDQFYSMLGFKQIGALKHYPSVNAPAIARALSVADAEKNPFLTTFFGKERED